MRALSSLMLLACSTCLAAGPAWAADGDALDLSQYKLTFDEPFDTLSVSPWGPGTRWISHIPWKGAFGDAKFVDPQPGFPFAVKDGILDIEMRKGASPKWTSGILASVDAKGQGFSQQYGYFEMRAKLPGGPGVWPAFWLVGLDRSTHTSEIDVMEHYGSMPDKYTASVHVWDRQNPKQSVSDHQRVPVPLGSLYQDFHTYGVSVDATTIRFYFDRRQVWEKPTPPEFHQPFYILVDLSCGAGWPIANMQDPSVMSVDYVQAYAAR
jgi:beta-glucanase (GH16 family)